MAYVGLRLEGAPRFKRTLKQAGQELDDMKTAHKSAAGIVASRASSWAPSVTGRLAGSVRASGTKTAAIVRAGNNRKSKAGVPYANPIHWGWRARNIRPNPFLSYSAQSTEPTWLPLFMKELNQAISKVEGI